MEIDEGEVGRGVRVKENGIIRKERLSHVKLGRSQRVEEQEIDSRGNARSRNRVNSK